MKQLTIDLQDGFEDDTVVIEVDGREVYRKAHVRTRQQIGLADTVVAEVAGPRPRVEVRLLERRLALKLEPALESVAFLGVSLGRDGRLESRESAEPFGYL